MIFHRDAANARAVVGRLTLAAVAFLALLAADRGSGDPGTRLVGVMHENLTAVNEIVEGVARDDYQAVENSALALDKRAQRMRGLDLRSVGLDVGGDSEFLRHLDAQQAAAEAIRSASRRKNAPDVLSGVQLLLGSACIPCHQRFRKEYVERTPPVLFMRTLLSSTMTMNRGLVTEDYSVIAREAREVSSIARVFNWSQVAEALFGISDPADREAFRGYLARLVDEASRVESAAFSRDSLEVTKAFRGMLLEGCVACHERFRQKP
jgi:cytochrome c556